MTIDVLVFGPQARLVQADRVPVTLDASPITTGSILEALKTAAPALAPTLAGSRLAINHAYASAEDVVAPGDEVALIGMVSGG